MKEEFDLDKRIGQLYDYLKGCTEKDILPVKKPVIDLISDCLEYCKPEPRPTDGVVFKSDRGYNQAISDYENKCKELLNG